MLLFQLLFLMFLFIMIGEPFRVLFSRSLSFFRELDILQACIIDVYLGGLFLYVIALVPLHLFTMYIVWGTTALFAFLSIFLHRELLKKFKFWFQISQKQRYIYAFLNERRIHVLKGVIVFGMFLFSLWVQLAPLSNFVFGNIHDTSLHALFVELILENGHIPATHQPYLAAAIIYPQGAHVIFAYSCYILRIIPPKAVFYVSPLFSAMTILAAYSLGKKVHHTGNLDVVFAFIMTFVSMWPTYITWGSNPFILGFPLYLICLSFLPYLYDSPHLNIKKLLVIGVLCGYLGSIHLAFYEVMIASAMLWLLIEASRKPKRIYKIGNFLIICIFSIFPIAPFLYRYVKYYPYPGHNIGLPSDMVADITSPPTTHGHPFQSPIISVLMNFPTWVLSNYNIHPNSTLRILWVCLVLASFLTLYFHFRKKRKLFIAEKIALISFGASILLNFCTYILPAIPWSRIILILYVSLCLLISAFSIRLYSILHGYFAGISRKIVKKNKKVVMTSFMATFLLFSALFIPFVYYTTSNCPRDLHGLYNLFAVTAKSDYELMTWMRYNLQHNATILISPCESGGFIPGVSQKKVVFPFSAYLLSSSYRKLINLIQQGSLNETTYELMNGFEISHVFLGSQAVQYWGKVEFEENPKWDPLFFLGNPNFKLVKNIGGSYLFNVSCQNPNIVFQEDFEYLNLTQMGWCFDEMEKGNYNLTIIRDEGDNHLLRVWAERNESSRWLYSCWLNRKIYLWSSLNVTLSFHLNASSVKAPNTVSISIFDADRQRHITFATPSVLYKNQQCVVELNGTCGDFSCDISDIWERTFDELLPNIIIIELAVVNVDNISRTDVFFDNVTITINQQEI